MTRSVPACFTRTALLTAVAIVLSALLVNAQVQDSTADTILRGRLATVEPAARRITMVPDGEANLIEIFIAPDGEVRLDERTLTLADLVIQVGQRVSVTYVTDGPKRIARVVTVETTS